MQNKQINKHTKKERKTNKQTISTHKRNNNYVYSKLLGERWLDFDSNLLPLKPVRLILHRHDLCEENNYAINKRIGLIGLCHDDTCNINIIVHKLSAL